MAVPRSRRKRRGSRIKKLNINFDILNKYTLDHHCIMGGQKQFCFKNCKRECLPSYQMKFIKN